MRSILISLIAALTAPLVTAVPHPDISFTAKNILTQKGSQSGLVPRDDLPNEKKIGYLIFSHGCFSSGSGFPHCGDLITMKWGKEGEYKSCNDHPVDSAFEKFCSIKSQDMVKVDTPMGQGIWQRDVKSCGKGRGREGLILTALDDFSASGYECVRDDHQFSENCGFTWASHSRMKCTYKGELE
ncbi:hypothetical protein POX_h09551 [Penicillium oxalicum]|uniref:Uncharacterized protein n=1 Tax=Penicillium oxalicum (strain 114-2 / CGMCC 5302) TaxID=933388 RepID=S7ZKU8_PENO1|nr:hypothetical protein POX_h09551 [Penicillium oxalicum]EPS31255.1 hypothetical protein PDE_06210 [Penicillium oxalicum 114-2]KAI2785792.1 hypothetical protein POX_h09551 [Penicillium oxalicum]